MFNIILVYSGYILGIEIMLGTSYFGILNVSGYVGYPFRFEFGLDDTHNPKYHKTKFIRYLCQFWIGFDLFLSDQIRFICPVGILTQSKT